MRQTFVIGFILSIIGGGVIGYSGGFWSIVGMILLIFGHIMMRLWGKKGPYTDWVDEDTFFVKGVGQIQSNVNDSNFPPGGIRKM